MQSAAATSPAADGGAPLPIAGVWKQFPPGEILRRLRCSTLRSQTGVPPLLIRRRATEHGHSRRRIASSLFPQLPKSSRIRFRLSLIILSVMLTGFAVMRWPVPMLGTALAGIPVLFVVYLRESTYNPTPLATLLSPPSSPRYQVWDGHSLTGNNRRRMQRCSRRWLKNRAKKLVCWVLIPISEALLIVTIATRARLTAVQKSVHSTDSPSGALGALVANAASTATLLAPQWRWGLSGPQPADSLLVEAPGRGSGMAGGFVGDGRRLRYRVVAHPRTTNASQRSPPSGPP